MAVDARVSAYTFRALAIAVAQGAPLAAALVFLLLIGRARYDPQIMVGQLTVVALMVIAITACLYLYHRSRLKAIAEAEPTRAPAPPPPEGPA